MSAAAAIPKIGISSCLMGESVRHNGGHCRNDWITQVLAEHVKLVPFCPEAALGLGIPRPAMRLVKEKKNAQTRLITSLGKEDLTEKASAFFEKMASRDLGLSGYIMKKDSPSCGLERVNVYSGSGMPTRDGVGLFAEQLRKAFPLLPMIEEGRLTDLPQRENFLVRVFAFNRLFRVPPKMKAIQDFHRTHKYLLMEHHLKSYAELGKIVGNSEKHSPRKVLDDYSVLFMKALEKLPTTRTRTNALQHALGYLRGKADREDRAELERAIQSFLRGDLPFIAPLTLVDHLVKKHKIEYLRDQWFFGPYPRALQVRTRL